MENVFRLETVFIRLGNYTGRRLAGPTAEECYLLSYSNLWSPTIALTVYNDRRIFLLEVELTDEMFLCLFRCNLPRYAGFVFHCS